MALAALCIAGLSMSGGALAQDTGIAPSPSYTCDALYAVSTYGVNGMSDNAAQASRGAWKVMQNGTFLASPELVYRATSPSLANWGIQQFENTIALGPWGGGNGDLTMYSWGFYQANPSRQYLHYAKAGSTEAVRIPASTSDFLPSGDTPNALYAGGEVYQKTGEIYYIGPHNGAMSAARVRIFNPATQAYVDSGPLVAADSGLTGTAKVQGDMAIDAEGNIYTIIDRGSGVNATLIRIVPPARNATGMPPSGGWKYDKVADVGFSIGSTNLTGMFGMAFVDGVLYASVKNQIHAIDVYSGDIIGTYTMPWEVYDLAACQTAPVVKGKIYHDINGDGNVSGDPGLAGVVVELYKDGVWKASRTTTETGEYSFILDSTSGTFSVRVRRPTVTANGVTVSAAQSWASAGGTSNLVRPQCAGSGSSPTELTSDGVCAGVRAGGNDPDTQVLADAQYVTKIYMSSDGEVAEADFGFTANRNFGDAPNKFGTLIANNGPQHWTNAASLVWMGGTVTRSNDSTGTADGDPNADADSSVTGTSDDGVKVLINGEEQALQNVVLISGKTYTFTVDVAGLAPEKGYLNAWIAWTDTENFTTRMNSAADLTYTGSGNKITFTYQVPTASAATTGMRATFARFRFSTSAGLGPKATSSDAGYVQDGEVEDYKLNMAAGELRLRVKSEGGTGEFKYLNIGNISSTSPSTANQTLTTTVAGTAVEQAVDEYHIFSVLGSAIEITQTMPSIDWNLTSATCSSVIGDGTATPLTITVDKPNNKVTIDGANVVSDATITCEFVNSMGASLTMTKSIDAEPLYVGVPFDYVFTINNGSSVAVDKITFSDLLPANISVTSLPDTWACTFNGAAVSTASFPLAGDNSKVLTCVVPVAIAGNGNAQITLPSIPTATTTTPPTNTATWIPEGGEGTPETPVRGCPSPLQAGVNCTEVTASKNVSQLLVDKSIPASEQPLVVGQTFYYEFAITNNTTETLTQIVLSDLVPANVTIVTLPANATCNVTPEWTSTGVAPAGVVTCTITSLSIAPGGSHVVRMQARPEAATAGTKPINTVTWTPDGTGTPETPITGCPVQLQPYCDEDGGPSENVSAASIATMKELTDLAGNPITMMQVAVPALYRIRVQNTGTVATVAAIITNDALDASLNVGTLTTVSGSGACEIVSDGVRCTTPAGLAAGAEAVYTIQVTPSVATAASAAGITNVAKSYGGGDPNCSSVDETCDGSVGPNRVAGVQLKTTKSVAPALQVGSTSIYTIRVQNDGDGVTTNPVVTTDIIDSTLTIGNVTTPACSVSGQTVTCTTPAGLAGNGFVEYTIEVTPTAANAAGITNTATSEGGEETNCPVGSTDPDCTGTSGPDPVTSASIRTTKSVSATPMQVGVTAIYTIRVENTGTAATTADVVTTDVIDSTLTVGDVTTPGCVKSGQTVTCTTPAGLAGNTAVEYTIEVTPTAVNTTGITNTASSVGGGDPNTCTVADPCEGSVGPTEVVGVQLKTTKSVAPALQVGSTSVYTIRVQNDGAGATTNPVVTTDIIDSTLTIGNVTTPACSVSGQTVTCTTPAGLAGNGFVEYTIEVTPTAANTAGITNTATSEGGEETNCPVGSTDPDCTGTSGPDPVTSASIRTTKSVSATPMQVGVTAIYTIRVENTGTAATTADVVTTDVIDSTLTVGDVTTPGCSVSGQTVTCTTPAGLAGNTAVEYTIEVTPTAVNTTGITNTASSVGGGDPNTCTVADPCEGSVGPTEVVGVQLKTTKSVAPALQVGSTSVYTIRVQNDGAGATTNPVVTTDVVDSTLTIGNVTTPACSVSGQTVTCTTPAGLAGNGFVEYTIEVTPTAANTAGITNTATSEGGEETNCPVGSTDPDCTGTSGPDPVTSASIRTTKSVSASPMQVGVTAIYTIRVENTGTAATTADVVTTDVIDSTLTIGTVTTPDCSVSGQTVTCTTPAGLAGNTAVEYTIEVTPTAVNTTGITNTASSVGGGDPNTCTVADPCEGSVGPTEVVGVQLKTTKSVAPALQVGSTSVYTIRVQNDGAGATTNPVVTTDVVDSTLTIGNVTTPACSVSGQTVTCTTPAGLAGNGFVEYTIEVTPTAANTAGITNTATSEGGEETNCPVGSTDPDCTGTSGPDPVTSASIRTTKSVSATPMQVGVTAIYTIRVENTGTAATTADVVTTDVIDSTLTVGDVTTPGCVKSGQTVTCTTPAGLAGNTAVEYTIEVTPTAVNTTGITNTASSVGGGDPNTCTVADPCEGSVGPTEVVGVQLKTTKSVAPALQVGSTSVYTIRVQNDGAGATTNPVVTTDIIDSTLTIGNVTTPACSVSGQTVTCTTPAGLAGNGFVEYTIEVTPTAANTAGITNTATSEGGEETNCPVGSTDPDCTGTSGPDPVTSASIRTTKSVSASPMQVGVTAIYTIRVENTGTAATTADVVTTDVIDSTLTVGDVTTPGCVKSGQTVTCTTPAGLAGNTAVEYTIEVTPTAVNTTGITNTASSVGGGDPNTCTVADPCEGSVGPTEVVGVQLKTTKSVAPALQVGSTSVYTIRVQNDGAGATTNPVVTTDIIDSTLTIGNVTTPACSVSGQTVTCTTPAGLAGNGFVEYTIEVTPTAANTAGITNTATSEGGEETNCPVGSTDPDCTGTSGPDPVTSASIRTTKSVSATPMQVGVTAIYTIRVENTGTAATTADVVTTDVIDSTLTIGTVTTPDCSVSGQTVTCTTPAGLAGNTAVEYTIEVTPTAVNTTGITNTASSVGGGDPNTCTVADPCEGSVGPTEVVGVQLKTTKSVAPALQVGSTSVYTIRVQNDGAGATTNPVVTTDIIDSTLTIGNVTTPACSVSGQTVTCTTPAGLAGNGFVEYTIEVTPTAANTAGITNTATSEGGEETNCPVGSTDPDCTGTSGPDPVTSASIRTTKSVSASPMQVGVTAIYTIRVENTGTAATTADVVTTDVIDSTLTIGTVTTPDCSVSGQTVTCTTPAGLAGNTAVEYTIEVTPTAVNTTGITNTASSVGGGDPNTCTVADPCEGSVGPTEVVGVQLKTTKSVAPALQVGSTSVYTIRVQNDGAGATTNPVVTTDVVDSTLTIGNVTTPACSVSGQTVTCTTPAGLAGNGFVEYTIEVTPTAANTAGITNTATSEGGEETNCPVGSTDPDCTGTSGPDPVTSASIHTTKSVSASPMQVGVTAIYTIRVENTGTAATTADVVTTDVIDSTLTVGDVTTPGCVKSGQTVTCTTPAGLAGNTAVEYTIEVTPTAVNTTGITNTASSVGGGDPNTCTVADPCEGSVGPTEVVGVQLKTTKSVAPALQVGSTSVYTIRVQNDGAGATTNPVVTTDIIDSTLTIGNVTTPACSVSGQTVTCTTPAGLAGNGFVEYTIEVTPTAANTAGITNTATSEGGEETNCPVGSTDPDCTGTSGPDPVTSASIRTTKSVSATPMQVGVTAIYTIRVENTGTAATTADVVTTDVIDSTLTIGTVTTPDCSVSGQTVTCTTPAGLAGNTAVEYTIEVTPTAVNTRGITNTASSVGGGDPNTCTVADPCEGSVGPTEVVGVQLKTTKSVAPALQVGSTSVYTIRVQNDGAGATTNPVVTTDIIDSTLTIGNVTTPACSVSGQTVTCTTPAGLAGNGFVEYTIEVTPTAANTAGITNTATSEGGEETNCPVGSTDPDCTGTSGPDPVTSASIRTTKSVSATPMQVGVTAIYTIRVENTGTAATTADVVTTDVIDSTLTVGDVTTPGCVKSGQTVTCTTPAGLAGNTAVEYTIEVTPTAVNTTGITNTASSVGGGDPNTCTVADPCEGSVGPTEVVGVQLKTTKSVAPALQVGSTSVYTIRVQNDGAGATTNPVVTTDIIDSTLTIGNVTTPACSVSGQTVTCTTPAGLAGNGFVEYTIEVTPTAANTAGITNTATSEGGEETNCPVGSTDPDCTGTSGPDPVTSASIRTTKSVSASPMQVGVTAIYTIRVENTGTAATTADVVTTDVIDSTLTIGTVTTPDCSVSGQTVTCTTPAGLAGNTAVEYTIEVTPTAVNTTGITNTASSVGGGDPNTCTVADPCEGSVGPTEVVGVQLKTTKSVAPALQVGSTSVYTIRVQNDGAGATTNPVVTTDIIDSTLTIGNVTTPACSVSGQTVTCTTPAGLAGNGFVEYTIEVTPTAANTAGITNTATSEGGEETNCPVGSTDPDCTGTSGPDPVTSASIRTTKSVSATPMQVGVTAIYTIRVENTGTAATTADVVTTDVIDSTLTIGTVTTPDCSVSGQTVTCTTPAGLAGNTAVEYTIEVTPTAVNTTGITNTASSVGGGDPNTCTVADPCEGSVGPTEVVGVQLKTTKSVAPALQVGSTSVYTIRVQNDGAGATTNPVVTTDIIDSTLTIGNVTTPACSVSGQTVTCTTPAGLAGNGFVEYTIEVTPTAANTAGITNTATSEGGEETNCPVGSTDPDCTGTSGPDPVTSASIRTTKSVSATPMQVGVTAIYTIRVENTGTAATTADVVTTDVIDSTLTIGTVTTPDCSVSGQTVTCTTPAGLAGNTAVEYTIEVTPTAVNTTGITNTASSVGGGDPNTCTVADPCEGSVGPTEVVGVQLKTTKSVAPALQVGSTSVYTIRVQNDGAGATTNPVVTTDIIDSTLTIGNVTTPACSVSGQTVTCTTPAGLAGNGFVEYTIEVTPTAANTAGITNTATSEGGEETNCPVGSTDPDCTGTSGPDPVTSASIRTTKSVSASPMQVGVTAIYTIRVENTGTAATTADVVTTDVIDSTLTIGTVTTPDCSVSGQTVTCTTPAGLAGNTAVEYTIEVTPTAVNTTGITNTASSVGGGDPNTCTVADPCEGSVGPTEVVGVQLKTTKSVAPALQVGSTSVYTIRVQNDGAGATTNPVVTTDVVDSTLTIGNVTTPACSVSGQTVTCTTPAGLAGNGFVEYTIEVTPTAANTAGITNTATSEGGEETNCPVGSTDPDCTGTSGPDPVTSASIHTTKSVSASPMQVGVTAIYTIRVENTGTAATTADVVTTDVIDSTLTIGTVTTPDCSVSGQTVTCTTPAGLAGNTAVEYTIEVTPTAVNTTGITNTASSVGGGDPNTCTVADPCEGSVGPTEVVGVQLKTTKSVAPALQVGSTSVYTIRVQNDGAGATTNPVVTTDIIDSTLTIGNVTTPACSVSGQTVTCTTPAGLAGNGFVEYTIEVTPTAANTAGITNTATSEGGEETNCPVGSTDPDCTGTSGPDPVTSASIHTTKSVSASPMQVGVTAIYTIRVENTGTGATTADVVTTDVIDSTLTIGNVTTPDCSVSGQTVTCTTPAGLASNTAVEYTIEVTPTVSNTTGIINTARSVGGGDPNTCTAAVPCEGSVGPTRIIDAKLKTTKSVTPMTVGQPATYTITVTNNGEAATITEIVTTDQIDPTLTINSAVATVGGGSCAIQDQLVTCRTAAGLAGSGGQAIYEINVTPTQANTAGIVNTAKTEGGGSNCDIGTDPECSGTSGPDPVGSGVDLSTTKSVTAMKVGAEATYTITVTNSGSGATSEPTVMNDDVDATLSIVSATPVVGGGTCAISGQRVTCTTPAGAIGANGGTAVYELRVIPTQANASGVVNTAKVNGGGDNKCTEANACEGTTGPVVVEPDDYGNLRVVKTTAVKTALIGDLVRYTLTITNIGDIDVTGFAILDTPAEGFTYVEGSAVASNGDAISVTGYNPIRFGGMTLRVGEEMTVQYLLRVGAGVHPGRHTNTAVAYPADPSAPSISNPATADVEVSGSDPMLDESLILGTVYHDRNGNGMQDEGEEGLPGIRIASVEGYLIETDQYGRYHLEGILGSGGASNHAHGRNFILKVDPATLPAGAQFTTDNPLVRRITPGLPVRFDFGVQFDAANDDASASPELDIGEAIFAPGSAQIRPDYLPAIEAMVERIRQDQIRKVFLMTNADTRMARQQVNELRRVLREKLGGQEAALLSVTIRESAVDGSHIESSGDTTAPAVEKGE